MTSADETCVDVEKSKDNPGKHKGWAKDSPCDHDQGIGNDGREHGRGHGRKH